MRKLFLILFASIYSLNGHASEAIFTVPKGWASVEREQLPSNIECLVVGSSKTSFPPSINLSTENFKGSLEDYLNIVKNISKEEGSKFKKLGQIETHAGTASLSQTDLNTEYGKVRLMHAMLLHNETMYILTTSALSKEYVAFYPLFFHTMQSFQISEQSDQQ